MAALSEIFTVIADASVDPDSPITTSLMAALKNNDIHLREWIGASFFAGAEQDHDHDGVNSKAVVADQTPKEVADETTRDTTSASFVDLPVTSITYTAAELTVERRSQVVIALEMTSISSASVAEFALNVDGSDKQKIIHSPGLVTQAVTLVGQNPLVAGANRIIKVRFRRVSGSGTIRVTRSIVGAFLAS